MKQSQRDCLDIGRWVCLWIAIVDIRRDAHAVTRVWLEGAPRTGADICNLTARRYAAGVAAKVKERPRQADARDETRSSAENLHQSGHHLRRALHGVRRRRRSQAC